MERTNEPLESVDFGGDNLGTRARGVLERCACATLADAEAMCSVDGLHAMENCGWPTIGRIAKVMEWHGYRLRWEAKK